MPRTSTIVQVFVASPSDVQPEREALETLISELNGTWSFTTGLMFELVRWETHVTPAMGNDGQSVINEQIGDSYDVFIGILWGRFGTPTPRAMSGTLEEFERAYSRLQAGESGPAIMFYFKEAAIPVPKIDPTQIESVQNFRASLSDKGLYATFDDLAGFQTSVRAHLSLLAQRFARQHPQVRAKGANQDAEMLTTGLSQEDELGLLDYVEICEARIEDMVATMDVISDATARIGGRFEEHTAEMSRMMAAGSPPSTQSAKRVIKRCADDMEAYASTLKSQTPILASHREAAFDALNHSLTLGQEMSAAENSGRGELYEALQRLQGNLIEPTRQMKVFRDTAASLPRMTGDLNKAKRLVVEQIDALVDEFDKTNSTASNVLLSIEQMR